MAAVDEVVKKVDECINSAKAIFDDQYQEMARKGGEQRGEIGFSRAGQVTQMCIACNKDVVDYAIFGRWAEGKNEGEANINWWCRTFDQRYMFRGPRSSVVHQLLHISYQPRAA